MRLAPTSRLRAGLVATLAVAARSIAYDAAGNRTVREAWEQI